MLRPEDKLSKEDRIIKTRLEETFYKMPKNDIAGLVKNKVIILGEQQSTINENMPVRLLMYIGRIYEELLEGNNKYKKALIGLPTPEFYVFIVRYYPPMNDMLMQEHSLEDELGVHRKETRKQGIKQKI